MKIFIRIVVLAFAAMITFAGCKKKKNDPVMPTVTTIAATNITDSTAFTGGNVSSDGGATVTGKGVCWDTTITPTVMMGTKTNDGTGTGSYISNLTGLLPGKTYYIRAYATNSAGTAYGTAQMFNTTTVSVPVMATLTTFSVSGILQTSATCGGNISNDGGFSVVARGVCWSTSPAPTVDLPTNTIDGSGTGSFSSNITGLSLGTTYYVRAFATNSAGVAYGNEQTFTTAGVGLPAITTTTVITGITQFVAISGGVVASDGGGTITARGVCWGTSSNPTVALATKTANGTGTGTFTSNMTGLNAGTVYYVRAYATNSAGTAYGIQRSFTTAALTVGLSYGGGLIAYILQAGDPGYDASVKHGLIVASTNQSNSHVWGCYGTFVGGTSTALGTGLANTNIIVSNGCGAGTAAKICADLVLAGYSDWYLPSRDELYKVHQNAALLGGLTGWYRSSSEGSSSSTAWEIELGAGTSGEYSKSDADNVRAMRSF